MRQAEAGAVAWAFPEVFAFRLAGSLLVGETWNRDLFAAHGALWALLAAAIVVALLAVGLLRLRGRERQLLALCVTFALVFFAAPLVLRGGAEAFLVEPIRALGSRYVIVPLYLGYVAWVVLAGGLATRLSWPARARAKGMPAARVALPALIGVVLLAHLAANYAPLGPRTESTSWRQAVTSAEVACARGQVGQRIPSDLPRIAQPYLRSPGVVWLPVAPWTSNWPARIPCDHLER